MQGMRVNVHFTEDTTFPSDSSNRVLRPLSNVVQVTAQHPNHNGKRLRWQACLGRVARGSCCGTRHAAGCSISTTASWRG